MTGPARARRGPTRSPRDRPDGPVARPERREEQVVRRRPRPAGRSSPRSAPVGIVRADAAEGEGDAQPDADRVRRDEQAVRPLELVGEPGGGAEGAADRRSRCRTRRPLGRSGTGGSRGQALGTDSTTSDAARRHADAGSGGSARLEGGLPAVARPRGPPSTNPSNSGCGRSGRLLNSGWNWLATNHGWSCELDDLDEPAVGRLAGQDHAGAPRASGGSGCSPRSGGGAARR